MPYIYLSPSGQEGNPYHGGGTEEYYMNRIADEMIPYLTASGIGYMRNTPDMTAAQAVVQSNERAYDLHLALHSNGAPESQYGTYRGIDAYYSPKSRNGKRAADIFVKNLKMIYPIPSKVRALPTTTLAEVDKTRAPAVLLELGYHDNPSDAEWIKNNISAIAENLVLSIARYFDIPLIAPTSPRRGYVNITSGNLNLRTRPNLRAEISAKIPDGAPLTVLGQWQGWYCVNYLGRTGYVLSDYVIF